METVNVDVLVCGGGMSGMSCAAFAAESGAKVLVIEKQAHLGGSSAYSAGMFWAPETYDKLRSWVPEGEAGLQRAWHDDYLRAVQWMRESGVPTAEQFKPIMTIGISYPIKIPDLYRLHSKRIQDSNSGSRILNNTHVVKLLQEQPNVSGSRVIGAIVKRTSANGDEHRFLDVRAKLVVMATGGFQGSRELRARYLGPGADNMFVRSNSGSVGDGLNLATSVGADTSGGMSTYYGHLLAAPLRAEDVTPKDFLTVAQYQSRHCLLINEAGKRFTDESTGDEVINQYLAKQEGRRGFLLFGNDVRQKYTVGPPFPNGGSVDRLAKAREHECNVIESSTLEGLIDSIAEWGVDTAQTKRTLEQYHQVVGKGDSSVSLDAPVGRGGAPAQSLVEGKGPYFAMEVQPAITFTYGGISIDNKGRALTRDKTPIPGLLVAGVDAGGFSNVRYAGGLALAFVTGYWAAKEVSWQLNLPVPSLPEAAAEDLQSVGAQAPPSRL